MPDARQETLHELQILTAEHRAAMDAAVEQDERYRLHRMMQELNACIERLQQELRAEGHWKPL